jgi:hypothetical protein
MSAAAEWSGEDRFREDLLAEEALQEWREARLADWVSRNLAYLSETCGAGPWQDAGPDSRDFCIDW